MNENLDKVLTKTQHQLVPSQLSACRLVGRADIAVGLQVDAHKENGIVRNLMLTWTLSMPTVGRAAHCVSDGLDAEAQEDCDHLAVPRSWLNSCGPSWTPC